MVCLVTSKPTLLLLLSVGTSKTNQEASAMDILELQDPTHNDLDPENQDIYERQAVALLALCEQYKRKKKHFIPLRTLKSKIPHFRSSRLLRAAERVTCNTGQRLTIFNVLEYRCGNIGTLTGIRFSLMPKRDFLQLFEGAA